MTSRALAIGLPSSIDDVPTTKVLDAFCSNERLVAARLVNFGSFVHIV